MGKLLMNSFNSLEENILIHSNIIMGYTNKKKHKYKKKKHTRKIKFQPPNRCTSRGGSGKTNINIGFHAPALGMITKGNSKFKDYDGDKLTSIVNMTHNDSINNLVDNVDERLASIVYGKNEQNYPQPVYKKHISIQVPPFGRIPRPDIGTGIPPVPDSFPRPDIGTGIPPVPDSFPRPDIGTGIPPVPDSFPRPDIGTGIPPVPDSFPRPDIGTGIPPVPDSFPRPDIGTSIPSVPTDTPTAITITDGCASGSTHYKTLGVDEDATIDQIRKAYKIKSRQCHPDKRRGNINATTQQTEINNAKDILIDVEKRKQYDEYLHNQGGKSKKRKVRKSKGRKSKRRKSKRQKSKK